MKNKTKALIVFIVAVIVLGGMSFYFKQRGNDNLKDITIMINSKRDSYQTKETISTAEQYLGEVLKKEKIVDEYEDSTYGMYIHSVKGMKDDQTNQYWWSILIDGEMANTGVDGIVVEDGRTYTLELKQGY